MIGDLHCHSKLSDGSTSLEDIVFYAKRAGLDALAITDHDTLAGASRAQVLGKRYGITVIPGVEISTFDPDTQRRVHILCYLPLKPDRLAGLLSRTLEQRRISGEQMIQKVSRLYPVTREHILRYAAASNSIYKVHIMQALLDLGYDTSIYGQLYAQLFSDSGGSCLVKTVYPSSRRFCKRSSRRTELPFLLIRASTARWSWSVVWLPAASSTASRSTIHETPRKTNRSCSPSAGKTVCSSPAAPIFTAAMPRRANPLATCVTDEENLKGIFELHRKRSGC